MRYTTSLSPTQQILVGALLGGRMPRLKKYDFFDVLNAIGYVLRSGCQWRMLPHEFPHWKTVYHHFRSWSARGWFRHVLKILTMGRRGAIGQDPEPETAVIDSQSVRWGHMQSPKGYDGYKRVKGIKRHIAVDDNGYPIEAIVTTANVHDSRAAYPLVFSLLEGTRPVRVVKADMGYRGALKKALPSASSARMVCVASGHGDGTFRPIEGRWVVEATFSWMDTFRRLCRNSQRSLEVARDVFIAASVFFMLRYF